MGNFNVFMGPVVTRTVVSTLHVKANPHETQRAGKILMWASQVQHFFQWPAKNIPATWNEKALVFAVSFPMLHTSRILQECLKIQALWHEFSLTGHRVQAHSQTFFDDIRVSWALQMISGLKNYVFYTFKPKQMQSFFAEQ